MNCDKFYPSLEQQKQFKRVQGYAGRYAVTIDGVVWDKFRNIKLRDWVSTSAHSTTGDHRMVVLARPGGKQGMKMLAKLVAETWLPPLEPGPKKRIRYKDGNSDNVHADNLEWVSSAYDRQEKDYVKYIWYHPHHGTYKGQRMKFARYYKLNSTCVGRLLRCQQKTHLGWSCIACERYEGAWD